MKLSHLWSAVLIAVALPAFGQEYSPYPKADISKKQWQRYFDQVQETLGNTAEHSSEQKLVVFSNATTYMSIAFTTPGHAAHPAWVTRRVVEQGGKVSVQQIGYFAGREEPFAELFRSYLELNDKIRAQFPPKASEAPR